jgi:glycosyltransferase involved in cell wall biosynthesis
MAGGRVVHHLVPHLAAGDAVGAHALRVQRALAAHGHHPRLYAGEVDAALVAPPGVEVLPARALRPEPGSVLLYQQAIGTALADGLADRGVPLVLNHHTSSPPELFDPWDAEVAALLRRARQQLRALAPRARGAIAVSAHNAAELRDAGCARVAVAPVLFDVGTGGGGVDEALLARLRAAKAHGGADWLFVGRLAPNKAQHDVIEAFAAYRHALDPAARLHLVGGAATPAYAGALHALVAGLGLEGAVHLPGPLGPAALAAHYRAADVFVCLSDHEGFCVPLVEAFAQGVPVVAFDAAAVAETVGGAGVVLPEKAPAVVASAVARVLGDDRLRAGLAARGRARARDFAPEVAEAAFVAAFDELVGAAC